MMRTCSVSQSLPASVQAALTASNVGLWQTCVSDDRYIVDETAAKLFGVDGQKAALGLPLALYARAIHPADRAAFRERVARVTYRGGLFVHEYRTIPHPKEVRWVLTRGRYEHDPVTGRMQGRGILIDLTESKLDGHVEDRALFVDLPRADDPLDQAALLALETREVIDGIADEAAPALREAVDALLWVVGRALARRMDGRGR